MYLDTDVEYSGKPSFNETETLLKSIYDAISCHNSVKRVSVRDSDCILVDFKNHFTSWGHYDDLEVTGWYIQAFTSYEDSNARMWLVRYP